MKSILRITLLLSLLLVGRLSMAEPLVRVTDDGIQPNAIVEWEGDGREVLLTLRDDVDPSEVARAIQAGVDRIKAKVRGGQVVVLGKSKEELLPLLAGVEIGEAAPLAELAQLSATDADFGSGSSLRAKKRAQVEKAFADKNVVARGQVVSVELGTFPHARLTLRILQSPRGDDLKKVAARGRRIVVVPQIVIRDDAVDFAAEVTQMNTVAYYLKAGDEVRVRLGARNEDGTFVAEAIDR